MAFVLPALPVTGTTIDTSWGIAVRSALNESAAAKAATAGKFIRVTSAGVVDEASIDAFDLVRDRFRANRRLIAEYSAQENTAVGVNSAAGIGWYQQPVDASDIVVPIGTEPVIKFSTATVGGAGLYGANNVAGAYASPSHSLRMLLRVVLPAASANVTRWMAGFGSNFTLSTQSGAYLRILTTGNVFFVTRQGGTETTTDLGALARTSTVIGFEIETVDAGVTWVCRNQAGTVLATHTTNVPTAATGLSYAIYGTCATGAIPWGVAYARVEGTFA